METQAANMANEGDSSLIYLGLLLVNAPFHCFDQVVIFNKWKVLEVEQEVIILWPQEWPAGAKTMERGDS